VAVAVDADGDVVASAGTPGTAIFPRSAAKLLQGVAMVRAGLALTGPLLALACASHSGERYHLDGVQRVLRAAGLEESALRNAPGLPLGGPERARWEADGRSASALAQNCSGQHAAMLVTCQENGWPLAGYLEPGHPLQQLMAETVADLAGEPVTATGVDGCGAPVFAISALGLACAFARIASARPGSAESRVAAAVRTHPEWLGGTGRDVTLLISGLTGLIAKDGAEGVFVAAMPDGRTAAVKIADGSERARLVVTGALLRRLGVDAPVLDELATVPVLGGGRTVGMIEAYGF
jgi:L-asparaginase II